MVLSSLDYVIPSRPNSWCDSVSAPNIWRKPKPGDPESKRRHPSQAPSLRGNRRSRSARCYPTLSAPFNEQKSLSSSKTNLLECVGKGESQPAGSKHRLIREDIWARHRWHQRIEQQCNSLVLTTMMEPKITSRRNDLTNLFVKSSCGITGPLGQF